MGSEPVAIIPAAGEGRRMAADKALLDLGGRTAVERLIEQCRAAGSEPIVVRARGAGRHASAFRGASVVEVEPGGEMIDSLKAAAIPRDPPSVLICPVDHPLVTADTMAGLIRASSLPGKCIALPIHDGRPGHPIALSGGALSELRNDPVASLREIVRRDPARVAVLPTSNPWCVRDLDSPEDLRLARAFLAGSGLSVTDVMRRHRSRRAFTSEDIDRETVRRLVDAARHCATSSFIQAASVVVVRDPAVKDRIASLCGEQDHIRKAPVFLAICADASRLAAACERHGSELQRRSLELFLQAAVDAALVGQNLQLAAESEGLGGCMIGGARNHPVELAELLSLPNGAFVLFGMTLGHPADDPLPRDRLPLEGVLHEEKYEVSILGEILDRADQLQRAWAERQNAERRGPRVDPRKGWTERMAAAWGTNSLYARDRKGLRSEIERLGFGFE